MRETLIRAASGLLYVILLIGSLFNAHAVIILFFIFGLICIAEFQKLTQVKSYFFYVNFSLLYLIFGYWPYLFKSQVGLNEASLILLSATILVQLLLIQNLFSTKTKKYSKFKAYIYTTLYASAPFVFLVLIANYSSVFNPIVLLSSFILVWVNDSFAYLVGKNFGRHKLFESISPKKTIEGFLGGLFFSFITSYFIATFTETLTMVHWLILSLIISVFGTLGDLVESKFKRQSNVKDSGNIMPGHGGLLDRLDSIIFAAPFIYLFLRIIQYVS
ncbi:phosphatidate cytidylyltransferase [Oceanihabitans sp. IOP_32]|uniref:phosphatidate cytidylyltransferase n=1 Tax=Oceanihabitans sp. IOP_32 TaxID=2529032 RepID=UPI0012938974|nr:phosphatidate cytidylyltransferase [Oceanihabitans sp. IOP_32]QFZ55556.1 phosphatidate cytidylyltransferase [Oceanihabitans sp. IOP_32]